MLKATAELMNTWCARHALTELVADGRHHNVTFLLPPPHAMLILHSAWKSVAFPYPRSPNQRGVRLNLIKPLWSHYTPVVLQQMANQMTEGSDRAVCCLREDCIIVA